MLSLCKSNMWVKRRKFENVSWLWSWSWSSDASVFVGFRVVRNAQLSEGAYSISVTPQGFDVDFCFHSNVSFFLVLTD